MNGKSALGVLLVIVGSIAVLNFIGINFGAILGFLLPFILIGLGIVGWMNSKKWIGGILIVIGSMMLLGKLGGIIMLALAIGLIVVGVGLFKKDKRKAY
jgi:predicted membrane protein